MARLMNRSMTIALGFACLSLFAADASSSTIDYNTQGLVLPFGGVTGTPAVSFSGVNSGQFTEPNSFAIGDFTVTPPADGSTTTYNNAEFLIQLSGTRNDVAYPTIQIFNSMWIYGRLNGSVSSSSSSLVATVDAVVPGFAPPNPPGQFLYDQILPFAPSSLMIAQNTALPAGSTTLTGLVQNTPEPATLAIFGVVAAAIGLRHRARKS